MHKSVQMEDNKNELIELSEENIQKAMSILGIEKAKVQMPPSEDEEDVENNEEDIEESEKTEKSKKSKSEESEIKKSLDAFSDSFSQKLSAVATMLQSLDQRISNIDSSLSRGERKSIAKSYDENNFQKGGANKEIDLTKLSSQIEEAILSKSFENNGSEMSFWKGQYLDFKTTGKLSPEAMLKLGLKS